MENFLHRPQSTRLISIWWHFSCLASAYWMPLRWRWHWYGSKCIHKNWTSREGVTHRSNGGYIDGYMDIVACTYNLRRLFSVCNLTKVLVNLCFDLINRTCEFECKEPGLFQKSPKICGTFTTHSQLPPINLYVFHYPLRTPLFLLDEIRRLKPVSERLDHLCEPVAVRKVQYRVASRISKHRPQSAGPILPELSPGSDLEPVVFLYANIELPFAIWENPGVCRAAHTSE